MKRNKLNLLAIVLIIVLTVVGCNKSTTENETTKVGENNIQESNYIHLTMLFPSTINPILNTDKSVSYMTNLVYDGLFEINGEYNVEKRLVDDYSISSDGTSIDIKLLDNAIWHDGSDITSNDVSFTIDLIKKTSTSPYYNLVSEIKSVKVNGSKNLTITFNNNDPFAIDKLTFPIVSDKKLGSLKTEQVQESKNNLVGNGPYIIKKYVDRQYMILERNTKYFGDLPENRKQIYVKMVPDEVSQKEMVISLDSDIASINLADLSKYEDKDEFNTTSYQGRDYELVMFNYNNDYLKDINFRKAILASIDREKILKDAYVDNGTLANMPLYTTSKYFDNSIKSIAYNKDNAQTYLKKGLISISKKLNLNEDKNSTEEDIKTETIIEDNDINGSPNIQISKNEIRAILADVELKIIVSKDNDARVKVANMIKEDLQVLGVKSTIEELDEKSMTKALETKKYDLAVIGYYLSSVPDVRDILKSLDLKDAKLNDLMNSLGKTTSEDKTKKIYSEIQKRLNTHASYISIGVLDNFIVSNQRLEGAINPNDFDIYKGISNLQVLNKLYKK